jgi:protein tyrosine phosphatase (PTP) superfamily phosphohydrolase (DUF442 family)
MISKRALHRSALVVLVAGLAACAGVAAGGSPAGVTGPGSGGDLGIENEGHPLPGVTTGGLPTEEVFNAAAAAGYRTVVSLLIEGEPGLSDERHAVESRGMRFVHIPIAGEAGLDEENARAVGAVLNDPEAKPVLLHCSTANRTGAIVALAAYYVDRQPVEDALELGRAAGLDRLEGAVRAQLERAETEAGSSAAP